jgi:hypothetical protein
MVGAGFLILIHLRDKLTCYGEGISSNWRLFEAVRTGLDRQLRTGCYWLVPHQNVMLRRTKREREEDLGLPPKVMTIRRDNFSEEELDLYNSIYSDAQRSKVLER